MPYVQTRFLVATGFLLLAGALAYSHALVPDIDYATLVKMRSAQSIAIGFLFVPITTLAYLTVPRELNDDASALFTMFRNVAGSIGISLSTALIRERTQARMAHLSGHMSTLSQNYNDTLQRTAQTIAGLTGEPLCAGAANGHRAASTRPSSPNRRSSPMWMYSPILACSASCSFRWHSSFLRPKPPAAREDTDMTRARYGLHTVIFRRASLHAATSLARPVGRAIAQAVARRFAGTFTQTSARTLTQPALPLTQALALAGAAAQCLLRGPEFSRTAGRRARALARSATGSHGAGRRLRSLGRYRRFRRRVSYRRFRRVGPDRYLGADHGLRSRSALVAQLRRSHARWAD